MSVFFSVSPLAVATVTAKVTLLLAAGWGVAALLRRAPAGARHLVWLTVLVGILLVPVISRVAPLSVPVLPAGASALAVMASTATVTPSGLSQAAAHVTAPASAPAAPGAHVLRAPETAPSSPHSVAGAESRAGGGSSLSTLGTLVFQAWLLVAVILLARILYGTVRLTRVLRRSRPLDSGEWSELARAAASHLGLASTPRVVMSDEVEMAFACRALGPLVVIPSSATEWSSERRSAVLLHEFAHVRRRDLIGHALANVACSLYWFNPLVWSAARRLRIESELASDDLVLGSGVRPSDYAQHLLDMVTTFGKSAPGVALAMARPKDFEGRLIAILDRTQRRTLGLAQRGALVGGLGVFAFSVAGVVPVPRSVGPAPSIVRDAAPIPADSRTRPLGSLPTAPARTSADAAVLSDAGASILARYGTGAFANPMQSLLRIADQLHLNGSQADSVATLGRGYVVALDGIWRPIMNRYAVTDRAVVLNGAPAASVDLLADVAPHVLAVLTSQQRAQLPAEIAARLDAQSLRDMRAQVAREPDRVFAEAGQPGARSGGPGPRGASAPVGRGGE